ncbi:hypothetical protein vseg_017493 [Gypsophila vaccaria]
MKSAIKWTKNITTLQVEQLIRAEKDLNRAISIFDSASAEYRNGFRHDHATFRVMIARLVSGNQFKRAEELLGRMREEQCRVEEDVFMSICRGYGRVHKPVEAVRVFEGMRESGCEVSERCYVTLLSILVDENQLKMAMRFYRFMRKVGFEPSVVSLNVLIKALCKNNGTVDGAVSLFREMPARGCEPDAYTYGTLISGLCKFGRVDEASELFGEMRGKGCVPTVVTYSSLIHGLCKCGKLSEAMALFEEMKSGGVKPNVFTYSSVMDGLCKCGRSSQAVKLLDVMVGECLSPNMVTYSTLIQGLCKDGDVQKAVELFDRMKLQGLKPDAGLYGKIISSYCDLSKFHEAGNFLDEMVLAGISPNRLTWNIHVKTHNNVIRGLCETDINRAFHLYLSMRTRGLSVEPGVFAAFIKGFCKKSNFDKACQVLDHMVGDGCLPDEEVWRVIVKRFTDDRKVLDYAELLQGLFVQKVDETEKLSVG